ncbi:hypothetical protein K502DRAFT_322962, partial [Neoconidiobolus thromboides FSU 785]
MSNGASHNITPELEAQIDSLYEKVSQLEHEKEHEVEILKAKYFVKKEPHFKALDKIFQKIDNFWGNAIRNSGIFDDVNTPEVSSILDSIKNITVDYREGNLTNGALVFEFNDNDYISNKKYTRDLTILEVKNEENDHAHPQLVPKSDKLEWKAGKEIKVTEQDEDSEGITFIEWLTAKEALGADTFFIEELYPTALDFYIGNEGAEDFSDDEEVEDDDEEDDEEVQQASKKARN